MVLRGGKEIQKGAVDREGNRYWHNCGCGSEYVRFGELTPLRLQA